MKRDRQRSFSIEKLIVTHPDNDHAFDATFTGREGELVFVQAKGGTGETALCAQAVAQRGFYGGSYSLSVAPAIVEGESEKRILEYLLVDPPFAADLVLKPPPLADFLLSLIPLKHRANLPGDLEEDYWARFLPRHGLRKARFLYWAHVIYAILGFLTRPLVGIAGLAWVRKFFEEIIYRMMR